MGQLASQLCNNSQNSNQRQGLYIEDVPFSVSDSDNTTDKKSQLTFEDFEIIDDLGHGAFGYVYQVKKKTNKQEFAMKTIKKSKLKQCGLDLQIVVEKNILLENKHPFLLNLKYAFQSEKRLYLVLDYCQGGQLLSYIKLLTSIGKSQQVSRFIAAEVLLGLEYMHSEMKIMYRDLKPENILVCSDGHLKIADFGLAKHFNDENERTRGICGTLEYIAPEIINCLKPDFPGYNYRVDIWSFGILLYEIIIGKPPFTHPERNQEYIIRKIMRNKVKFPKGLKSEAQDLIEKCLQSNPEDRPTWSEIKKHPFFEKIDWEMLFHKEIISPLKKYIPQYEILKKDARPIIETESDEIYKSIQNFNYIPQSVAN